MMIVAIGGVVVYQLFLKKDAALCRRNRREDLMDDGGPMSKSRGLIDSFSNDAKRKGKLTPKMQKELAEISGLMDSMEGMGDSFGSELSKLNPGSNSKKSR